ncbi:MAG: LamG domain-containing protein, partial [Planctomycetota bacterium]
MTGRIVHGILAVVLLAAAAGAGEREGLIGHWTFDAASDGMFRDSGGDLDARIESGAAAGEGVFGSAAILKGRGVIRIKASEAFSGLDAFGISTWVRPVELSDYREIFRKEDGNQRILFSFQHGGTILSLGLNIEGSGYKELDARTEPAVLKDGRWHHVAGTYDGRVMRVYLDGAEIGAMERRGPIVSGGDADAFIGSLGGGGEFFQGGIDDLRIWNAAPSAGEIVKLYEKGLKAELAKEKKYAGLVERIYQEKETFAATTAAVRRNLMRLESDTPDAVERLIVAKLAVDFPDQCGRFNKIAGGGVAAYLAADDNSWNVKTAERVVGLATEYMPLTEGQWAGLSEAERRQWREVEKLKARFERLKATGDAGTAEAEWVDLIIEGGGRVVDRPVQYEAVAPYVKPYTPATRDYSAAEAREMLRRDWLHQIDGKVTAEKVLREIGWAKDIAERIQ